ncbi:hypothetical protein [Solirubrobacter soli]|uniref:hypothetical protein n=1 Tax=Solirubrobacter soli TaxID=363832 RepID=UPI0012FA4857|nr:hypothetical protein [Solirubrobacter soli]
MRVPLSLRPAADAQRVHDGRRLLGAIGDDANGDRDVIHAVSRHRDREPDIRFVNVASNAVDRSRQHRLAANARSALREVG